MKLRYKSLRVRCTREINIRVVITENRKRPNITNIFSVVTNEVEEMTRLLIIK